MAVRRGTHDVIAADNHDLIELVKAHAVRKIESSQQSRRTGPNKG